MMKSILISNSLLVTHMTDLLAREILSFTCRRRLAVVMPAASVTAFDYTAWRDLQATLRSIPAEWRSETLRYLRWAISSRRQEKCTTPAFQVWLQRVRETDAELGVSTTYTPHKPGLFLPVTPAAPAPTPATVQAVQDSLDQAHQAQAELLRPVRQRAKATHPPAATAAPAPVTDAQPTAPVAAVPSSSLPHAGEGIPTMPAPQSSAATSPSEPSSDTASQSQHGTTPHAPETPQASGHQDNGTPHAPTSWPLQSHGSAAPKKHSSANPTNACGYINCDGFCPADNRPPLIRAIDQCADAETASEAVRLASTADIHAAAEFLGVPLSQVFGSLIRRACLSRPL